MHFQGEHHNLSAVPNQYKPKVLPNLSPHQNDVFTSDSEPEDRREPLPSINIMTLSETFTVKIVLHLHVLEKR